MPREPHRGASNDMRAFALDFVASRMEGFKKDIDICLTGVPSKRRNKKTHAYFPALSACCGTLEYLTALHRGTTNATGWRQIVNWSNTFLPQPDYCEDTVRILFEAFRHSVAHRGIASGIWNDRRPGDGHGRRITWKIFADSKRPACALIEENGILKNDPPWPCNYSHRMHIHLLAFSMDLLAGPNLYRNQLESDDQLVAKFESCMKRLYQI